MEILKIEGQELTPKVTLDPSAGLLQLTGRSIPANAVEFYAPVIDWIKEYSENPASETTLLVNLEYFNTSSSKKMWDIMKQLKFLQDAGKTIVKVEWHYEEDDEDLRDAALEYEKILGLNFKLIPGSPHR